MAAQKLDEARELSGYVARLKLKLVQEEFSDKDKAQTRSSIKELNKRRIEALGLYLIPGGKE